MSVTVTSITPRPAPSADREPASPRRRPFRDNPRLILAGIGVLVAALVAMLVVANRTPRLSPDFLADIVLYGLTAADLTILTALAFVLARNIVKLVVERRRALPFARFRARMVAVLLGMTLVPAVLVLIVGSELIRNSVDRWFNAPMDEVLSSAKQIASDYYHERQLLVADQANQIARSLSASDLAARDTAGLRDALAPEVMRGRVQRVRVYRAGARGEVPAPVADVAAPSLPASTGTAASDQLAAQVLAGASETRGIEGLGASGDLIHAAAIIRSADRRPLGVVVATDSMAGDLAQRSRRMTEAYESYSQLRVLKVPLTGVYLMFFLMMTLMILVGATWTGLYLAKRMTWPVQMLAAAAREIGAGRLDQHVEAQSNDEFSALVDAFNTMASELARSRTRVERSTIDLEQKHQEVENRRRYIETILERITTGVVSLDADGCVTTINSAAARLLTLDPSVVGEPMTLVFGRPDLMPLCALLASVGRAKNQPVTHELAIAREGQELHLAVGAAALGGDRGQPDGLLLVVDDVTPLIRAQKVAAWREVARRLAHEIKNPLTPIQLSAERLRRHFGGAQASTRALVDECTTTIIGEVDSLKGLVDEFSQFARMPSPRTVPTDLAQLLGDTLSLYNGIFTDVSIDRRCAAGVPPVRLDPEQIRRVVINLVDNAIEAMDRRGEVTVETGYDRSNGLVRIVVADDGPGIPLADRDKLFLPYYSTKGRGSGLGLAIVRRIIAEHGGNIEVGDNAPRGTRFTIELPC